MKLSCPTLLLLVACTPSPAVIQVASPQPATGSIRVLDAPNGEGDTGWWPSVVFDSHGTAHIAFCDAHHGDVRYATQRDGTWSVRSIVEKGAVGKYIALAIDAADRLGVSYYDQDRRYLRYAFQRGAGAWGDEQVAWGHEVGMASALAFDPNNQPHIFYYVPSGKLAHATRDGPDNWRKENLAPVFGTYSVRLGVALQPDGLWLSFVDWKMKDATLYLGHLSAGGFSSESVASRAGPGWHSQLLFHASGAPLIVHSASLTAETHLSHRDKDGWHEEVLLPHASTFAAAMYNDAPIIAYQDQSDIKSGGALAYVRQTAQGWQAHTIDTQGPLGSYIGLAVSKTGRLVIAYYADSQRSLKIYDEQL